MGLAPKPEEKTKVVKPPKAKAEGENGEQKERKERVVRSFPKNGILRVTPQEQEKTFRGKRQDYYDTLKAHDGKTVETFLTALKAKDDPKGGGPGAWLRWFVDEELVKVEGQ
jgi:TRAP-type C4-dicarboxylate transport system substrate-binding protein